MAALLSSTLEYFRGFIKP